MSCRRSAHMPIVPKSKMYLVPVLFSVVLLAAANSPKKQSDCKPKAKDQVAWQVVKALEKETFYLFKATSDKVKNCTYMKANETKDDNKTATLITSTGLRRVEEVTTVVGDGNHLKVGSVEFGSLPVWYTDNSTCSVLVAPDEKNVLLWVAGSTAANATFDECCKKVFKREAKKANQTIHHKFSKACLKKKSP
ncbi:allergen Arg r 1-like isoform X2 [Ornithodoros turicata]|uniref:allergen Arg r 1-like isoform X2 n=1 Tax=Ornithodoros turicata TaxID=34597 RepID=UPI003139DC18